MQGMDMKLFKLLLKLPLSRYWVSFIVSIIKIFKAVTVLSGSRVKSCWEDFIES